MRQHKHENPHHFTMALTNELRLYRKLLARARAFIPWRRARQVLVPWLLAVVLLVGPNSPLVPFGDAGMAAAHALGADRGHHGRPNRFDPHAAAASINHLPNPDVASSQRAGPPQVILHPGTPAMKDGLLPLQPNASAIFVGSDGRLELDVPAGAVTPADVAAAGGAIALRITQIAPASGGNAGGSGHVSLGTYLLQLVDARGVLVSGHGLRQPVTLKLHYGGRETALDLRHVSLLFHDTLPAGALSAPTPQQAGAGGASATPTPSPTHTASAGRSSTPAPAKATHVTPAATVHGNTPTPGAKTSPTPSPTATATPTPKPTFTPKQTPTPLPTATATPTPVGPVPPASPQAIGLHAAGHQPAELDANSGTLTASSVRLSSPSAAISWDTNTPVDTFGKPDPFTADLSAGGLSATLPIDLPAGPGGLTPPLSLNYSSASVAEQHNIQAAAPWTGEGWTLSLGSISWSEHQVCPPTCVNYEDSWQLSDPFGNAADLIPPNINVATYYDDSGNGITPSPVQWHSAPESHARIYSFTGPNSLPGMSVNPPCFRVFLPNGIMEEFGCTPSSLQYYPSGTHYFIANWLLDLITDPQGNQIQFSYQADTQTINGMSYPRDIALQTIEYDAPGCHNAQSMCTGSAWAPLMRVNFAAGHAPARLSNSPSGCNTGSSLRCDDPLDLSGSGGLGVPEVQNTFVLNDVQVQVRTSGSGSWNTLRDYQLGYEQTGPTTIVDPVSGQNESTAGELDLTSFKEVGDDGSTSLPQRTFTYTTVTEHYEDSTRHPSPSTNCGPSWNTGNGSGCLLWNTSEAGNSRFLASASNGLGLATSITWSEARNNTHGVNGGGSNDGDPRYCDGRESQGYPCNEADDQNWSRGLLVSRTEQAVRASSNGNTTVTSTTGYQFRVNYPLGAQECADCVAGMNWGDQTDGDFLDYYNGRFMGFAQATVAPPDGSLVQYKFYATEGWGVYDTGQVSCASHFSGQSCHNAPWWDLPNAVHSHPYEIDYYDTDGTTLLAQTKLQYAVTCPPSGVSGTPASQQYGNWDGKLVGELDHGNPVAACDVQTSQQDSYTYDRGSSASHATTSYSYDAYGRLTSTTANSNGAGGATGSPTSIVSKTQYIYVSSG